jgi:ATP-dependent Lon protease
MLFALQSDLLEIWTKLEVEEYYQNIVLAHLDTLPLTEAEERISKEIKDTYEGRSSYFKLTEQLKYRKQALSTL